MITSNDDARALLFAGFDAWQEQFFAMLGSYATAGTAQERSAIATRFIKDITIPYIDSAKEVLLKDLATPIAVLDGELAWLLAVFGEGGP